MFNFLKRKKIEKFSSDELKEQMIRYSEEYIGHIEKKSGQPRLDYNIGNLEIIEILLNQAHEIKEELSEDRKFWIASRSSAYISEIARTNFGGKYHWNKKLNPHYALENLLRLQTLSPWSLRYFSFLHHSHAMPLSRKAPWTLVLNPHYASLIHNAG